MIKERSEGGKVGKEEHNECVRVGCPVASSPARGSPLEKL